jgi:hypothetical protein
MFICLNVISSLTGVRFDVLTAIKIQVVVFLGCDAVGYQCFRGPHCLHLQGEVNGAWNGVQEIVECHLGQ